MEMTGNKKTFEGNRLSEFGLDVSNCGILNFCCSGNLSLPLKSLRDSRLSVATIFFGTVSAKKKKKKKKKKKSKCADLTELLPARRFLAGVDSNQHAIFTSISGICYYRLSFTVSLTITAIRAIWKRKKKSNKRRVIKRVSSGRK